MVVELRSQNVSVVQVIQVFEYNAEVILLIDLVGVQAEVQAFKAALIHILEIIDMQFPVTLIQVVVVIGNFYISKQLLSTHFLLLIEQFKVL